MGPRGVDARVVRVHEVTDALRGRRLRAVGPVDFQVSRVLQELLVGLLQRLLREVSLPVGDHGINVGTVLNSDGESTVPFIELDVKFYGPVEQSGLEEDSLGFRVFLAVEG